jgi:dTDP-4-amino-4,6-dideoxygalactose transaminase
LTSNTNAKPEFIVPLSSPDLTDAEREAVAAVLKTPNLSMGPHYRDFEAGVAEYTGLRHAIAVSSGTAGLHLCVRAAGITSGDLVLTTPFSFVASSNVLLFEDAIPVFVDVDPLSGNIDTAQLRQAAMDIDAGGSAARKWLPRRAAEAGGKLKAVLPVDVFGQPADMDEILEVASQLNLTVIEDACEAIGAEYKGHQAGTLGDSAVFAFYPNKQMTTAEGGVVVTDDDAAADFMRALRNQGRAPGDTWLQHTYLGYNYRMDELSAALGRVQLGRLGEMLAKRERVASWYEERLAELPLVETPQVTPTTTRMSWFVYVIRVNAEIDRDGLVPKLVNKGIPSRPYFAPIHLQPYMVEKFGYQEGDFPVTEDLGKRGLALPFSSVMTEKQVELVCQALGEVLVG